MTPTIKAGALTPANDNRTPRRVQNWPTGKRLLQAGRYGDHAMLAAYRDLLDLAWGAPANDNWRDPAPSAEQVDSRAPEERIDQLDMIFREDCIRPTIDEMRELSCVPWSEDAQDGARTLVTWIDAGGVRLHTLGNLEFCNGAHLWLYGDMAKDRRLLKRPTERRRPHRARRSDPTIAASTGSWSLEDQIGAREEIERLWDGMSASSIRLLEHAIGSTLARNVGEAFRKQGKAAERLGVRLIDRAIDHLRQAWRPQIARRA